MEPEDLLKATQVVELRAKSRSAAIRELVLAGDWKAEGVLPEDVIAAVEGREATAQTVVAPDMALPHATIDWKGDFRVMLGRSRRGVQYGAAGDVVHLVVLLVLGSGREPVHLETLAHLARLFQPDEFRRSLVNARNAKEIVRLLTERAVRRPVERPKLPAGTPPLSAVLVRHAVELARSLNAQALLLAVDRCDVVPWESLNGWTGRLLVITTESSDEDQITRPDTHLFDIAHATLSRADRANLGLLLAAAKGLASDQANVVCVTGPRGGQLDSISVTRPGAHFRAMFSGKRGKGLGRLPPAVILRVLSLAVELAGEGREAHPVGALFVIGDSRQVVRYAQQLVLNPFHGFARSLRNVLDPSLAETIKEFAQLDGAFLIESDGTALTAGTYLVPKTRVNDLPGGLGTRHQAAAGITADTRALAITVSQSTGTVTVFQDGSIVLTLERAAMTRW